MSKEFVDGKGKKLYLGYETDEIVANPELDGTEVPLTSLKLGDDKYKLIGSEDLDLKADLTNENQTITADKIVVNKVGFDKNYTSYEYNKVRNYNENPNNSSYYGYNDTKYNMFDSYIYDSNFTYSRQVGTNYGDLTRIQKGNVLVLLGTVYGIEPVMSYSDDDNHIRGQVTINPSNGIYIDFNSNRLWIHRNNNKLTYNNNEIIDEGNIDNQFLTDAEMNTLLQEVFEQEVVVDEPTVR